MAIRFKRVQRVVDPRYPEVKRFFPVISYKFDTSMDLLELSKVLSANSGMSEGTIYGVLKDFRTLLRKMLLSGRAVNVDGLGFFYLAASSKGAETPEELTADDITGLRVCFRANKSMRLVTQGAFRSAGLAFKDLDFIGADFAPEDEAPLPEGGGTDPEDGDPIPEGGGQLPEGGGSGQDPIEGGGSQQPENGGDANSRG